MRLPFPTYSAGVARKRRSTTGFTFAEVLVALVLGVTFLAAVALTSLTFMRGFAGMYNYTDMNMTSRFAMDQIARDVRSAKLVTVSQTNELDLLTTTPNVKVTYFWDQDAHTLEREKTGQE